MSPKTRTIALLGALALFVGACSATPQEITVNSPDQPQTGISVSGVGEVTGTPDTVEVDLGVSVLAATVSEATATATAKADAIIAALTGNGVSEEDITTTDYSIYPEYDYSTTEQRLLGYRVNNTVRAKIRDIEQAGPTLDAVTAAAGDDVRVSGLRFSIEDDAELVAAARQAAWDDASAKATQLAELSGQSLGPANSITETVTSTPPPIFYGDDLAGGRAESDTPIEPGTSMVTITLQVQFALDG